MTESRHCAFCSPHLVEPQTVAETDGFLLVADLRPLLEGHLLIIPREHLPCYGALPQSLEPEFLRLKAEAAEFLAREYGAPVFFEHGVAAQTVPHAHLHAVPSAPSILSRLALGREWRQIQGLDDLRTCYAASGPYLYYEEGRRPLVLSMSPGSVSQGYLKATLGLALCQAGGYERPEGREAAGSVRRRWQRHRMATGRGEIEVVTCFLWRGGLVCLFKRSQQVGSGRGKWHTVSGYLPLDREPLRHAYVEVREETGLQPPHIVLRRAGEPVVLGDAQRELRWRIHPFLFQVLDGEPILSWEHEELAWVAPQEIATRDCVRGLPELLDGLRAGSPLRYRPGPSRPR